MSAQAELATSQDRIGVLEAEAFRAKDGLSALLAELETLRQANAALQGELTERNDEADALGSEVKAYRDEISALVEQASEKTEALSNLRMEIEARDSRIGAVEAELARKVDEVGLLQAQLRDSEHQTEHLLETHRKAKARTLAVSLGQVRSRDHQIAMLQAELKAQREQTSKEIVQAEARVVSERERADAELEKSAALTHARENTIEALREELEAQEAARQRLAAEIMEFRRELETWHALSKEREQRLAETQERLSAIEASTFWNLTSPLRSTVTGARSFGRSVKGLARRAASGEIFRRRRILEALPAPAEAPAVQPTPEPSPTIDVKARVREEKRERLRRFMEGSNRIVLRESDSPIVTVIIVTYNSPELVYGCLSALSQNLTLPAQTIIFDNCSDKETIDLLYRIDGASITLHDENLHFLRAVNLAALPAKGRYLLILNSDAEIAPGAVESAIETLEQIPNAGAVGGRIILPDGTLQEAGCIIWNDGSCAGYGRGGDPEATEFNWRRVVDFCSAVFLVVPRKLFASLGGFDEDFAPAYYEEVDLAVRMRQAGKFVIYDPRAVVIHHEYGSSDSARATDLMRRNQAIFRKRHAGYLMGQLAPDTANLLQARSGGSRARRILYIEDDVPVGSAGSGMPRTREIIRGLVQLGFELTFVALRNWARAKRDAYEYLPLEVEFAELANQSIEEFLEKRRGFFARMFVSRPHNMAALAEVRDRRPDLFEDIELIYDAEAIFARREMMRLAIEGVAAPTIDPDELLRSELGFAGSADRVITVSPIEQAEFRKAGVARVDVLAHAVDVVRTDKPFRGRQDFLFVGRLEEDDSPNVDSVVWFITEVLPLIDQLMDAAPRVFLVGRANAPRIKALESTRIILVGEVDNVRPWYESCRIFVAPTRFAAGIPLKVCEAGAGGIPVVATDLVFAQLGWSGRPEFRSGTSA